MDLTLLLNSDLDGGESGKRPRPASGVVGAAALMQGCLAVARPFCTAHRAILAITEVEPDAAIGVASWLRFGATAWEPNDRIGVVCRMAAYRRAIPTNGQSGVVKSFGRRQAYESPRGKNPRGTVDGYGDFALRPKSAMA